MNKRNEKQGSDENERKQDMPVQLREAQLVPTTFNDDDNSVEVVWTTGARVRRFDWYSDTPYEEELVVEDGAVDMSRFAAGTVQVLDGHRVYGGVASIIGIATEARLEDGTGVARIRLSTRPEMAGIVADIKAGIIRAISFGYSVQRYEVTPATERDDGAKIPLYRAVSWQPHEISFVTVPADANASTRSQPSNGTPCEFVRAAGLTSTTQENTMDKDVTDGGVQTQAPQTAPTRAEPQQAPAQIDTRAADIVELCTRHNMPQLAADMIRKGDTLDQARSAILDALARNDSAAGGQRNVRVQTVSDEHETRLRGVEEAIMHRIDPTAKLTDNGRQYRGMSLLEVGRELLHASGVNTRGMERMQIAGMLLGAQSRGMHTTSDFPALMSNVAGKRLRNAYEESIATYHLWARRGPNAPDFKQMEVAQMGGAPELLKTNEHGEFTYGTFGDAAEKYALVTYGRVVSITRQAIVNDDLRAFDRLLSAFGGSARRLENRLVYSQLTSNANMSDGKALFHVDHGNLSAGGGSALSLEALASSRAKMRKQTGLSGEPLNISPSFLLVPASLEQEAYQFTSSNYVPAKAADINEFRSGGRTALEPIIEPILDSMSASAWYLAANNGQIDTVEYCYLDGADGPVIESELGFEVDGMSLKCRLDFAAKAIDWRGLQKSAGA